MQLCWVRVLNLIFLDAVRIYSWKTICKKGFNPNQISVINKYVKPLYFHQIYIKPYSVDIKHFRQFTSIKHKVYMFVEFWKEYIRKTYKKTGGRFRILTRLTLWKCNDEMCKIYVFFQKPSSFPIGMDKTNWVKSFNDKGRVDLNCKFNSSFGRGSLAGA